MKKQRDMSVDAKLGFSEHFGYFLGSGVNVQQALFGTFLLVYYTNVAGINAGLAATVIAISKILDGISDLLMGYLVDHTKSKLGKARPWLLRMMAPTVICAVLAFFVPATWGHTAQIIYMFITYNLANTVCYTALAVPYSSLCGLATMNQKSRGINGGLNSLGTNVLFTILVNSFFLKISGAIGGGELYTQKGFIGAVIVYMIIYVIATGICVALTRERVSIKKVDNEQADNTVKDNHGNTVGIGRILKSLFTNKYWLLSCVTGTLIMFLMGTTGSATVYYTQYVLGNVSLQALLSAVYSLSMIPTLVLGIALIGKLGKRNCLMIGMGTAAIGFLLPLISTATPVLIVGMLLKGFGFGFGGASMNSIVQDAITYGMWKNGFNPVGMGNAAITFAFKIGQGLGTATLGAILSLGNFDASLAVQAKSAITSINSIYIVIPAIISIICVFCMSRYDLDKKYSVIEADLKEGKYASDKE